MKKVVTPNRVVTIEMTEEAYRELFVGVRTRNILGSISFFSPVDTLAEMVGRALHEKTERIVIKSLLLPVSAPKPRSKQPARRKK